MDIYSSLKSCQDANEIVKFYNTILSLNNIDSRDLNDICIMSWDQICQNAPLSSLAIKMLGDIQKIDWKNILSLQFYDQIYRITKFYKKTNKTKKIKSHCVGFACKIDNNIVNGQTWDIDPSYPDISVFEYPIAKTVSHHGIFGGPYISKNRYSVTWTGVQTKEYENYLYNIPTPILLFEAMNNIDIDNIQDFIDFENKCSYNACHSLLLTDSTTTTLLERNNNVNITTKNILPIAHCNTYINLKCKNNKYDEYSLRRINNIESKIKLQIKSKPGSQITYHNLYDIIKTDHVWVNDDDWKTIGAFIFDPLIGNIHYFDRMKQQKLI